MKHKLKMISGAILTSTLMLCLSTSTHCFAQKKVNTDLTTLNYTLEEAPEWTSLFVRSSGWFGADGIYAIPTDGVRGKGLRSNSQNMLIFSDSMIGEIKDGKLQPGSSMVHNTVAYLQGNQPKEENIKFRWAETATGKPESLFIPKTPSAGPKDYYWLGDGFVNTATGNTYIFASRVRTMDPKDDWSFKGMGTNLITIPKGSKPPFKDQRQVEVPFAHFGGCIFINTRYSGAPTPDGYIYVYGVKQKNLVVSRVLPKDFENFSAWRFWDGKTWNTDVNKAAYLTDDASGEISISPTPDGRYALVFMPGGIGTNVSLKLGASLLGPFGPPIKLYTAKVAEKKFIAYNAKAHPSLSAPGELLITYNQNAYDFGNQLKLFPNLYHPFFLKLKFK